MINLNKNKFVMGFICALAGWSGLSRADVIDTNRPGFWFTTGIVPKGMWQLETGASYDKVDSGIEAWSLPLAELRFGLSDRTEAYLTSVSWVDVELGPESLDGMADMVVGIKTRVSRPEAATQTAFIFQVNVPSGDDQFTSDRWDPSAAFAWHHQEGFQIAGTIKVTDYAYGYQVDNGIALPFSLGGPHSAFIEWEANMPEHGENTHWLNGAYMYLLRDNMQIDFSAGVGLTDETGDYRLGVGFSIRPQ